MQSCRPRQVYSNACHTLARLSVLNGLTLLALLASPAARADLVSYYSFDGHTDDEVGGNDGVYLDGAVFERDPVFAEGYDGTAEGALSFDGNAVLRLEPNDGLPLTHGEEFSVVMWVRGGPQNDRRVFSESNELDANPMFNIGTQLAGTNGTLDSFIRNGAAVVDHRQSELEPFDNTWQHIAWVTQEDGTTVVYINGTPDPVDFSYPRQLWNHTITTIGGILRATTCCLFMGEIDDVRLYDHALAAEEIQDLLDIDCPDAGDTHCLGLTVDGPPDNAEGIFRLVAEGADDSGDEISYTFRAESAEGVVREVGPQADPEGLLSLSAGTWQVSVTVDDTRLCDDEAEDASCTTEVEVIGGEGGLLFHWPFDGDTEDYAGNNHGTFFDGVIEGDPVYVEGFDGTEDGAILFDGLDDVVVMQKREGDPVTLLPAFTISAWVNADGTIDNADDRVFSESDTDGSTAPMFNIGTHSGGTAPTIDIFIRNNANTVLVPHINTVGGAFDNDWRHIAYVDVAGTVAVYIDGELDAVSIFYDRPTLAEYPADTISVGAIHRVTDCCWFTGTIDDVRVFNYALDEDEVRDLFENVVAPPAAVFRRGDTDGNGMLDVTDPIVNLGFQFLGGVQPLCLDAFDDDDNGAVEVGDPIYSLSVQFGGGAPHPAPGGVSCGADPTTDALDCAAYPPASCGGG